MKKQITIILFLLIFPLCGTALAQSKIGHVNTKTVLDTIPSRKKALIEIQEISKKSEAELLGQDSLLQKAYTDYVNKKNTQSQTVNQYEENRIQKMQQDLQAREQELNANIQKMSMALNENTYKIVKEAVKTIANKKGLQYVIDQETALFAGGTDITSEVILEVLRLDNLASRP
ncbi:MAG: OmpH family outer membrane protein [Fluviicola sp.]